MAKLHLLGNVELLSDDGTALTGAAQPKCLAVLVYLAVAAPRGFHRRQTLLPLLWPQSDETRARGSLNQALHQLRRLLGAEMLPGRGDEEVGLDWARWRCDVVDFRAAVAAGEPEQALALYRGEFLPTFGTGLPAEYGQWVDAQRTALRRAAASAALELCDRDEEQGLDGVPWLRRASAIEPLDPDHVHALMQRLNRRGDDRAALGEYESFVQRLVEHELGPPEPLRAYASRLRAEAAPRPDPISPAVSAFDASTGSQAGKAGGSDARLAGPDGTERPRSHQRTGLRLSSPAAAFGAMLLIALLIVGGHFLSRTEGLLPFASLDARGELDVSKEVVLADFHDRTGEANLGEGITEALRIDLSQSRFIRLAPRPRVQQALRRMQLPSSTPLTVELAREIAAREGLEAVLAGEVSALGSGYVISVQLLTADHGRVLLSRRITASTPDQVIPVVDRLSGWLRRRLGESMRDLADNEPLDEVTTSSLEALKAYSAAYRSADIYSDRAVQLFEQAIALDSAFASAHRALGVWLYWRSGPQSRVEDVLTRAHELRGRLPERERLLVEGTYYHYARHDYSRATTSFEQMLSRDPRDHAALEHLALLFWRQRNLDRAIEMEERLSAATGVPGGCRYLIAAGRYEEAERRILMNMENDTVTIAPYEEMVRYRAVLGDYAAADSFSQLGLQRADRSGSNTARASMIALAGSIRLMRGQPSEGAKLLKEAVRLHGDDNPERDLATAILLAEFDILGMHQPERGLSRLGAALLRFPLAEMPAADRPYARLAAAYALAGDTAATARFLRQSEEVAATSRAAEGWRLHLAQAVLHARRQDSDGASEKIADGLRRVMAPRCLQAARAFVHDLLEEPDSAALAWETFLQDRDPALDCYALFATHALERLADLYERRGEVGRAAACSRTLLRFWADPDPALRQRVEKARRRAASALPPSNGTRPATARPGTAVAECSA